MKYKKIIILGLTGSGKTTLSNKLSKKTNIKAYHTDDLVFEKKWTKKRTEREFKKRLFKILQEDSWIIEGVHSNWMLEAVKQADLVIFIITKKLQLIKRVLKRAKKYKTQNKLKQKLKLLYKIFKWKTTWYKKCKRYSKNFQEIKDLKEIEKIIK